MSFDNPNDAPKADSVKGFKCDACEHLHLALVDEGGDYIAIAVLTREMVEGMLAIIDDKPQEYEVIQ